MLNLFIDIVEIKNKTILFRTWIIMDWTNPLFQINIIINQILLM